MPNIGAIISILVILVIGGTLYVVLMNKWAKKKSREGMDYLAKKIAEEQHKNKRK